ncbi:hypothetical protein D5S17_23865 [Pseudonocardiaceae bacterium YIM PH 21723]|nr:hypothetical protein D5S17_23865 [Pseudonocardiaceae bacterium YIM PH 21723]
MSRDSDEGDFDLSRPNLDRMVDFFRGGAHNFPADRQVGKIHLSKIPDLRYAAQAGEAFRLRATEYLVKEAGVRQFLVLAGGIPTTPIHEIAQQFDTDCRLVYVETSPITTSALELKYEHTKNVSVCQSDPFDAPATLTHPVVREGLDFTRPIALIFVHIISLIEDDLDAARLIDRYCLSVAPGSYLSALSNTWEYLSPEQLAFGHKIMERSPVKFVSRTSEEFAALLSPLELVPPGVTLTPLWRPPDPQAVIDRPQRAAYYAAVGRITPADSPSG